MKTPSAKDLKAAAKAAFPDASKVEIHEESEYQIPGIKALAVYVWHDSSLLGHCALKLNPVAVHKTGPVSAAKRTALARRMRATLMKLLTTMKVE